MKPRAAAAGENDASHKRCSEIGCVVTVGQLSRKISQAKALARFPVFRKERKFSMEPRLRDGGATRKKSAAGEFCGPEHGHTKKQLQLFYKNISIYCNY